MRISEVIDYGEPADVCDALGIEMRKSGSHIFIRCPSHMRILGKEDKKPTNCILTRKGYKCYACGASGDWLRMSADFLEMPYETWHDKYNVAIAVAKKAYPELIPKLTSRNDGDKADFFLTHKELSLIGLAPEKKSDPIKEAFRYDGVDPEIRRKYSDTNKISLTEFIEDDPEHNFIMIIPRIYIRKKQAEDVLSMDKEELKERFPYRWSELILRASDMIETMDAMIAKIKVYLKTKGLDYDKVARECLEFNKELTGQDIPFPPDEGNTEKQAV